MDFKEKPMKYEQSFPKPDGTVERHFYLEVKKRIIHYKFAVRS